MLDRRTLLAGAAGAAAAPAFALTPPRWETGAALPYAVQEIYPALWQGRLVVGGGFRARGPGFVADLGALWPTSSVVAMQPRGSGWESLPDLPEARHHPFLVALGSRLLAIGGFTATPASIWQMQRQCWVLDARGGAWREGPPLAAPQAEVVGGVIADRLYLAGGRTPAGEANGDYGDHRDTGAAWMLGPTARRWEPVAPMPTPRNSAAAAVLDGRLHVAGGRVGARSVIRNLAVHEAYDPARDRWETLAPMPEGRGGHAAGVVGGKLYAFGGESFGESPRAHAEVFAYDPKADRWELHAAMPEPRHGLGAVAAGRSIHLLGGAAEAGGKATRASHDIFTPA